MNLRYLEIVNILEFWEYKEHHYMYTSKESVNFILPYSTVKIFLILSIEVYNLIIIIQKVLVKNYNL